METIAHLNNNTNHPIDAFQVEVLAVKAPVVLSSLRDLRLPQDFTLLNAVEALPVGIPFRKPHKNAWIRTHPTWSFSCRLLETGEGVQKELCLVHPKLHSALVDEVKEYFCVPYVNRDGNLSFWPLRLPNQARDLWASSAITIAEHAKTKWIRVKPGNSQYEAKTSLLIQEEPNWDQYDIDASFYTSIGDLLISSMDHPAVRNLGEAV